MCELENMNKCVFLFVLWKYVHVVGVEFCTSHFTFFAAIVVVVVVVVVAFAFIITTPPTESETVRVSTRY